MSDESTVSPGPLRLKPRLRPVDGASDGVAAVMADPLAVASGAPSAGETVAASAPAAEAPVPTLRFKPRVITESSASAASPSSLVGGTAPLPAVVGDAVKFKLKPKEAAPAAAAAPAVADPGAQLIGALIPASPAAVPSTREAMPAPTVPAPAVPQTVGGVSRRTPPPFPVVAGPGTSRTNPSIPLPHVRIRAAAIEEPETFEDEESARKGARGLVWVLVLVALGAGGYFGWPYLQPHVARLTAPKAAPEPAVAAPATPATGLTPSDTLNKLAHAPAQAIDRAQDAIAARRAGGQARIDALVAGDEIPEKSKPSTPAALAKPSPSMSQAQAPATMAPVSPGLAASVQVEAAPDASPAFRTFVANAKISGVFQGAPPRAMINGKLTRVGESAEAGLGVTFGGVDAERRQLIFKDRSGATVSRKY